MLYCDRIYGEEKISDPAVLEIINLPVFKRLKDISQAGFFEPYYPGTYFSRYEHSLGCYIFLKRYNVSREELIFSLVHDISHGVFSHCIDYVLRDDFAVYQNNQDLIHNKFICNTNIQNILKKNNISKEAMLNNGKFTFQDKEIPDLCADRIDASLRHFFNYKILGKKEINSIIENLMIVNNEWVFREYKLALLFAESYKYLNDRYFTSIETVAMFWRVGNYLKYSLKKQYINERDLYTSDSAILSKINKHCIEDQKLKKLWDAMNRNDGFMRSYDSRDPFILCKSRIVDPLFLEGNKIIRVSERNYSWKNILKKGFNPKRYQIRFSEIY
jgi:hypothetical protein